MKTKWNYLMVLVLLATLVGGSAGLAQAHVPEGISGASPAEGTVGTQVMITGTGFGEKKGEVLLGTEKSKVLAWSDAEITFLVDKPQHPGEYAITVLLQGDKNPAEPLTFFPFVMQHPRITPGILIKDGNTVTVVGEFFGDKKGDVRLVYRDNGIVVEGVKVVDWSMNTIRFELPDGLTGSFLLGVLNEVGLGRALFNLDGSDPPVVGWAPPNPSGYGNLEGHTNSSGIYYKGQFYVFSTSVPCGFFWCNASIQVQKFTNHKLSGIVSMTNGQTDATPVPLVVKDAAGSDKLWLFHTATDGRILYTVFNGTNWDNQWHQVVGNTNSDMEVAPVYNPVTHQIAVYHEYGNRVYWAYSNDHGANWSGNTEVSGIGAISAAPSAVYYQPSGGAYDTLLAVRDSSGNGKVFGVKNGAVVSTLLSFGGLHGRPYLMDDQGSDGSDYIYLIYASSEKVAPDNKENTPLTRRMDKNHATWEPYVYQNVDLPPDLPDGDTGYYWYDSYKLPNGAINHEPNNSGGYDRVFYTFYGWYYASVVFNYTMEPLWVFSKTGNEGPGVSPPPADTLKQVSAGMWHSCAVRTDGGAGCWGSDDGGRIVQPAGTYQEVSVGSWHSCGLKTDGTIYCWGDNDGNRVSPVPTGVFSQISVADWHGCGVRQSDGFIDCWGSNDGGRTDDKVGPFKQVSSRDWHNCAVKTDGTLYCWGDNDGNRVSPLPADANTPGAYKQVSVGDWHSCAVRTNGTLVCWGDNDDNRVSPLPADANTPGTYQAISAGNWHTCALRTNGTIVCWGSNEDGRVSGTPSGVFTQIEAGDEHTCAIRNDGHAVCWGENSAGQSSPPFGP